MSWVFFLTIIIFGAQHGMSQPPQRPITSVGGPNTPPPSLPPGRRFQLHCSDQYAYQDVCDPALMDQFQQNAPPGYYVVSVDPSVFPGKNAHRYLVKYQCNTYRRCEDIARVRHDVNTYKPQNCNIGFIGVVPGGFLIEYKQFCMCYRRGYNRRRRDNQWWIRAQHITEEISHRLAGVYAESPKIDSSGNVIKCNDRDLTCGRQTF